MRVAIIGGGASGLITAHLLDGVHEVCVFERRETLGGHIRTPGKNTHRGDLPPGVVLDNGVIEFERKRFVHFHRLLEGLGVETVPIHSGSGLFLADGSCFLTRGALHRVYGRARRLRHALNALSLSIPAWRLRHAVEHAHGDPRLPYVSLSEVLPDDIHGRWLRMLIMYAYSTPYAETAEFPAALGLPVLEEMTQASEWSRIVGGVYTYIERILEAFGGVVHCDARIEGVSRGEAGVDLLMADGGRLPFDCVVIATTPDQTLRLLQDPSEAERRRFGPWSAHTIRTFLHTDFSMYQRYESGFSEFDLFEVAGGRDAGYNAYLNTLYGLDPARPIGMAYNLEDRVDPAAVMQVEEHRVPRYTVDALRLRDEVVESNGSRRTYYAGAWLGDGLHEGATLSALRVSHLLGGRAL